jgi:hypothetical protein
MGFRIALYTSSFFSRDSCYFRPRIQYSFRNCRSRCLLLVVMCLRQVSRRSRCSPRYLTSSGCTRETPFSWTGGHEDRLSVKVTWVDFISLAFMRHFLSQFCTAESAVWSLYAAISGVACEASTAVSSAKVAVVVSGVVGRSAVYMR